MRILAALAPRARHSTFDPAITMSDDRFYVTTPIYYVNDVPHLGTAYTTVVADAFARYHRMRGQKTHFLTGTDEHGLKLERAASAQQQTPQQFVDATSKAFRDAWPHLLVENDDFIRTTEQRHIDGVQALWKKCADNGDIYLGDYEGWYCVPCEAYYTEKELLEGNVCPIHRKPVERLKEPTYFFRLSKYGERLLALWEKRPEFVQPATRRNEVISFVRQGLQDLAVSRSSFKWGIPVPGDPSHVMFVWFDALANYLTALGNGELKAFWPPDLQLVGKDIIRFHTIYWPAFLMSAGLGDDQLPRTVFAHGFLTMNGLKMSKSLRNGVNPVQLAEAFGADELRYYLLREIAFGQDGDFATQALINRIRSELASTLGNLLHRTLGAFAVKFFEGRVPAVEASAVTDADRSLQKRATDLAAEAAQAWKDLEPHRALECAINLAIAGNKYFDESAPWALAKNPDQKARLGVVIYHVLEVLRIASTMLWPALPNKMNALRAQLGLAAIAPKPGTDLWPAAWGELASGTQLAPGQPVFRNITKDDEAALLKKFDFAAIASADAAPAAEAKSAKPAKAPAGEKPAAAEGGTPGVIQFGDVEKVDLRLGHVKDAQRIPKKDKLLQLTVDLGEEKPRTIIAGIALAYAPEALVGKQIVVVSNLAPRDFGKGLVSHGMLLACGPSESLSVVTIEKPMPAGTRVK